MPVRLSHRQLRTIGVLALAAAGSTILWVVLVPRLLELHLRPETRQIAETLLALSIHTWPGSVVETVNGLAYAMLGVPSILFPLIALKRPKPLAIGGFLLLLSGVLSMVAFAGVLGSVGYLTSLSVAGSVIYLLSLFPIAYCFLFRAADLAERPAQN